MKLEFLTEQTACLRPVLRETKSAEETGEVILPDTCPDASQVIYASGLAFLRSKELTEGRLSISAGVSGMALVETQEAGRTEVTEAYIPLTLRLEDPRLKPGMLVQVQLCLRGLDGHLVNPRKIMLRASVTAEIRVWSQCEEQHIIGTARKDICMLPCTAAVRCLAALGEKNYTVEDNVQLTPAGSIGRIAGIQATLRHTDARLTGTRAVLRGEAMLQILYLTPEGTCGTGTATLPFSQYVDLGDCREDDELQLTSCLTGLDAEPDASGTGLNVTLQILTTAAVWGRRELPYTGDIYALSGQLTPETEERRYESLLDRQYFTPVGRCQTSGSVQRVIAVSCILGESRCERDGETARLTQNITVCVLWEDPQGQLHGSRGEAALEASSKAAENCRFQIGIEELTASASPAGDGMELRVNGTMEADSFGESCIREVVGAQWEEAEPEQDGPGLIIRRVKPGERLWDLAKYARTTCQAIREANGLGEDQEPAGVLLIPAART